MLKQYGMTDKEKCLLAEYVGTGLTPRQIRAIKKRSGENQGIS